MSPKEGFVDYIIKTPIYFKVLGFLGHKSFLNGNYILYIRDKGSLQLEIQDHII